MIVRLWMGGAILVVYMSEKSMLGLDKSSDERRRPEKVYCVDFLFDATEQRRTYMTTYVF
jgi:hypothetical protein